MSEETNYLMLVPGGLAVRRQGEIRTIIRAYGPPQRMEDYVEALEEAVLGLADQIMEERERCIKICEALAAAAFLESGRHSAGSHFSLEWAIRATAYRDAAANIKAQQTRHDASR